MTFTMATPDRIESITACELENAPTLYNSFDSRPRPPDQEGCTQMDQNTELELQGILDRDRIVALMNRYFATIDDASDLDAELARSIFSDDVRVEHRGFTLDGIEDLAVGNPPSMGGGCRR
jgi:hypothetical protein